MLTDFYRGWMIEIIDGQNGFQSVCYSPLGRRFSDRTLCAQSFEAWRGATKLIDQIFACSALKQVIRDAYESEQLTLEDWQRLNQSLDQISSFGLVNGR